MFKSDFMEFFSHAHPIVPPALYLPVIGYMLYLSVWQRNLWIPAVAGFFALGLLTWTLLEYIFHRYLFHYQSQSRWGQRLHFIVHGSHHDFPNDVSRMATPPSISVPVALLFYGIIALTFGRFALAMFSGGLFGYICYETIHYAAHQLAPKRGIWRWLKQYHLRHHYKDEQAGYGVSSPIWDYVFGTRHERDQQSSAP